MLRFSSFKDISNNMGNLGAFIKDYEKYWAHIRNNNNNIHNANDFETLNEHISLVDKYWINLIEKFQLESIIEYNIEQIIEYLNNVTNIRPFGNCLKEIFWATMFFHDFGKINMNFQSIRMENPNFKSSKKVSFGSEHSKLSFFIYFNYYLEKILSNGKLSHNEQYILTALALVFGNSILNHHSGKINNKSILNLETINSALLFKSTLHITINENYSLNFLTKSNKVFLQLIQKFTKKNSFGFPLFLLLKLNYSLLTVSDYYATSEYMNNLKIADFGIIDSLLRKQIINSFVNNTQKPYNKELIENTEKYTNLPFSKLQERNHVNINLLRQKIASEAIHNLRKNQDKNLFYLEAPTGSGKTNISIALATELLRYDENLSKIFYVFPFTTLVDQTFQSIKQTINVTDEEIIQLHSKADFKTKQGEEGNYGSDYKNYIDYLFVNFPITVLTHIRFFDILKGNSKESNYILHRLANSIIIIDELQSYPPTHWDKIIYFLDNYSKLLNIRIIIMSATLPKIDELNDKSNRKIVELVSNRDLYFSNPNFGERVSFEIIPWPKPKSNNEKKTYLKKLTKLILKKSEEYASSNKNKVRTVIEFISKRTASDFLQELNSNPKYQEYAKHLISGEILESRRKAIIKKLKDEVDNKVIVATTQVIEAGVDIDMDIGFKDRSLIDSEEQLAGRINREAKKKNCKLYLFDLDRTQNIYKKDYRYKIQSTDEWIDKNYLVILKQKQYKKLYQRVNQKLRKEFKDIFNERSHYQGYFKQLDLQSIDQKFKLIDQNSQTLFIPINIHKKYFSQSNLEAFKINPDYNDYISGEEVFSKYIKIVENRDADFVQRNINLNKMAGIMSHFIISVFPNQLEKIREYADPQEKYGFIFLSNWKKIYTYKFGFDMNKIKADIFL